MIIELKRASVRKSKAEIETQIRKYIAAVERKLAENPKEARYPIESICIVGQLPTGWDNPKNRSRDEESLRPYGIRIITYDELIDNARSAYRKFLDAGKPVAQLSRVVDNVRSYGRSPG